MHIFFNNFGFDTRCNKQGQLSLVFRCINFKKDENKVTEIMNYKVFIGLNYINKHLALELENPILS